MILLIFLINGDDHLQRYEIVNGVSEVEGVTNDVSKDQEDDKASEGVFFISVQASNVLVLLFSYLHFCFVQMQRKECLNSGSLR